MARWLIHGGLVGAALLLAGPALAGPFCSTFPVRVCGGCDINVSWTVVNAKVPRPAKLDGLSRGPWCPVRWGPPMARIAYHFDLVQPPRHGKVRLTNNNVLLFASAFNGEDSFVVKQSWNDSLHMQRSAMVTYNVTVVPSPM
jgi:hypothetical protein